MNPTLGRPQVALNMIVRDEADNLPACLGPVRDLFDEIVVVDTGSQDDTRAIAAGLGATVFDFPWTDSFADARNEALRHTTADYVLWLDADDRVTPEDRDKLARLLRYLPDHPSAYFTRYRNVYRSPADTAVIPRVQLFPRIPAARWVYRAHAQILPSLVSAGIPVVWSDVVVEHHGLSDPAVHANKMERYLRLTRLTEAEHPNDPFVLYNMGAALLRANRAIEAEVYFTRVVRAAGDTGPFLGHTYVRLVECYRQLGRQDLALETAEDGLRRVPKDRDLVFQMGVVHQAREDWVAAERCFAQLLAGDIPSADPWGDFARLGHNLGMVNSAQGKAAAASEIWGRVLARYPDFQAAWVAYGEHAIKLRDWPVATSAWQALDRIGDTLAAAVLRARGHLGRREFEDARTVLMSAIEQFPTDLRLRLLWSHLHLLEGRDRPAAEAALLAVLDVSPGHAEATHNLEAVRRGEGFAGTE